MLLPQLRKPYVFIPTLFVVVYLFFGILYLSYTKAYRAPDEGPHYAYGLMLYTQHRIPFIWETIEAHQPPLYYLLQQPLFWMTPHGDKQSRVYLFRIATLLLSAGIPVLIYLGTRKLFPRDTFLQVGTTALVALNPQLIFMNGVINNDALASLAGAAALYVIIRTVQQQRLSTKALIWNMVVACVCVLSKVSVAPLAAIVGIVTLWKSSPRQWWMVAVGITPALSGLTWLGVHNYHAYHDFTAAAYMRRAWYAMQHRDFLSLAGIKTWLRTLFNSYWGNFGHGTIALRHKVYQVCEALVGVGALGMLVWLFRDMRREKGSTNKTLLLAALGGVAMFVGVFWYSLTFYQPQGRYLFPAIGMYSLFLMLGLRTLIPMRLRPFVLGLLILFLLIVDVHAAQLIWKYG